MQLSTGEASQVLTIHIEQPPLYEYREEHVRFRSGANILAGTLTIPNLVAVELVPAVVLIHGSGAFSRDAIVGWHRPFQVIADYLSRRGIAVLRYDKRGVAESSGTMEGITTFDLADDARAAFDFLRSFPGIAGDRVGLIGHSEGGVITSIAAARDAAAKDEKIAYVVLLGTPVISGEEILLSQKETFSRYETSDEAVTMRTVQEAREAYELIKSEPDNFLLHIKLHGLVDRFIHNTGSSTIKKEAVHSMANNWFRCFLSIDPASYMAQVKCPGLALYGSHDTQVLSTPNIAALNNALPPSSKMKVRLIAGLNHMLQNCKTGLPSEYGEIHEAIAESVLQEITTWINNRPGS